MKTKNRSICFLIFAFIFFSCDGKKEETIMRPETQRVCVRICVIQKLLWRVRPGQHGDGKTLWETAAFRTESKEGGRRAHLDCASLGGGPQRAISLHSLLLVQHGAELVKGLVEAGVDKPELFGREEGVDGGRGAAEKLVPERTNTCLSGPT